ncbi:MAG: DUF4321 domain-containing protein [Chitinispirillales bacterium]|jgi:hypothetical protein|nr:DUF4321 domain-containing protein [Chitinispirillales bacterium]
MALPLKDKKLGTLILVVLLGVIIGAYLNAFLLMLPGGDNVVKTFFTYTIPFGIGGFDEAGNPSPYMLDLYAIRFQIGFQFRFSLLSILGVFMSLYFFRWYK